MKWTVETKEIVQYIVATLMLLFGIMLTGWGFLVPPLGEISNGVLIVLGQTLTFAGAVFGINLHYSNELDRFKQEIRQRYEATEEPVP